MTFNCVKCSKPYETEDDEAYLCAKCNTAKMRLARELDKRFKTVGQKPSGISSQLDNAVTLKGITILNAKKAQS